jgi:hypothetical protein
MNKKDIPNFEGYAPSPRDFDAARTQIYTPFAFQDFDLTNARTAADPLSIVNISGDFLYVDPDPTFSNGVATLELNTQQDAQRAPFYLEPRFALAAMFKQIKLTWAAQPGKKLRILYSTGERVIPTNSAISTIGSILNPVSVYQARDEVTPGVFYQSQTAFTNAIVEAVLAAASNTGGVVVHDSGLIAVAASDGSASLLAKATAPTSVVDGLLIAFGSYSVGFTSSVYQKMNRELLLASGLRLDWFPQTTTVGVKLNSVKYTLR